MTPNLPGRPLHLWSHGHLTTTDLGWTACGVRVPVALRTADASKVTCRNCHRSIRRAKRFARRAVPTPAG